MLEVWQSMTCVGGSEPHRTVCWRSGSRWPVLGAGNRIEQCAGSLGTSLLGAVSKFSSVATTRATRVLAGHNSSPVPRTALRSLPFAHSSAGAGAKNTSTTKTTLAVVSFQEKNIHCCQEKNTPTSTWNANIKGLSNKARNQCPFYAGLKKTS